MTTLQRLNGNAEVFPGDGWSVFRHGVSSELVANFEYGPIYFRMPERGSHSQMDLIVALEGELGIRRDIYKKDKTVATNNYATHAAYFRQKSGGATHVYGAHYDFELDELAHPIFHAQIRSFASLWPGVAARFHLDDPLDDDLVKGMLRTVRVPTAQMDVFSLCLQLFADHLLFKGSGETEIKAFNTLIGRSAAVKGAGFQCERLMEEAAYRCYRAQHWYPIIV
jgi:hypothetical protein